MCFIPRLMYSKVNPFFIKDGIEPLSSYKWTIALEKIAIKVGTKKIPIIVPNVDEPIMTIYWFSTDSSAHEIIHYQQWLEERKISEKEAEEGYKMVDMYVETINSILDF